MIELRSSTLSPATGDRLYGARTSDWKYFESPYSDAPELYRLSSDPKERHNVAETNPEIVDDFREKLAHFRDQHRAPHRDKEPVQLDPEHLRQLKALGYVE